MAKVHLKVRSGLLVKGVTAYPVDAEEGDLVFRSDLFKYSIYRNGNWADILDDRLLQVLSTTDGTTTGASATLTSTPTPFIRLTNSSLTGLASIPAGGDGQVITLSNVTGSPITVFDETGTTAANRIKTGTAKPLKLKADASINLIYDATSSRWRIVGGTGSSSSSGSGTGDDLDSLLFQASFDDEFSELPSDTNSAVNAAAGNSNGTYSAANELYQLSYDASKTVAVGTTSTTIILSSAPTFTVAVGDMVISGTEARRVTVVNSTLNFTTEAFNTVPSFGAQITVSQAVQTKDIYNLPVDGNALSAAFNGTTFSEIMIDYEDTSTVGDTIFDVNTAPVIAYSGSSDGTTYGSLASRPTLETSTVSSYVLSSAGTALYLRFFALKTSGSGTVNILRYKAFMQKSTNAQGGGVINSAYAFTNGVGTPVNCSLAVNGGKTVVTLSFQYAVGVNSGSPYGSLDVYINGQMIPRFINSTLTPDASYLETSSKVITLDRDYSAQNLSVEVLQRVSVVDSSTTNTTNISYQQEIMGQGFQGFVNTQNTRSATTTTGTPAAGTFYSSITNRAPIVDISQDLKPSFGIERIMTQQIYQLQNEFGPNGEPVWGVVNDDKGLIRFVGYGWTNTTDTNGIRPFTSTVGSYAEITFYGTGLNLLTVVANDARATVVSIDGGSDSSSIMPGSSASTILNGRGYGSNIVISAASGLTLGVHTVRLKVSASYGDILGFEVLNTNSLTSLNVNPGVSYVSGNKNVLASVASVAYNSSFESGSLSSRGGHVVVYQKADGTIAKAVTPTNASQANLTSADHTNEEVVRTYFPREFGAGRTDDFSRISTGSNNVAFTLDDGTTTLVGSAVNYTVNNGYDLVGFNTTSAFVTITFVGTGLDLMIFGSGLSGVGSLTVDGTSISTTFIPSGTGLQNYKIVSGLPYGTHIVQWANTSYSGTALGLHSFKVYQPKKPAIPTGAIELCDYNIMASYIANTTSGNQTLGVGVLRKSALRELTYVGAFDLSNVGTVYSQYFLVQASATGNYAQYTFFGTGFDFRYSIANSNNATAVTVSVDGNTNLSGFTTSFYGGSAFTASTGVLNQAPGSTANADGGLSVSGLTLGLHTVKFTYTSGGASMRISALDIITPIHCPKSNIQYDIQNTLSVGSCALSDNRKTSPIKDVLPSNKAWVQAIGVVSNPSTTSTTPVPVPDLSCSIKTSGGPIRISYNMSLDVLNTAIVVQVYVDGAPVPASLQTLGSGGTTGYYQSVNCTFKMPVSPGNHKVDVYWSTSSATAFLNNANRNLLVEEV